jgi:hypothetical protein
MKKAIIGILLLVIILCGSFRMFCGIFVIQPIGALPEGATFVYWRSGTELPFISSPDGLLMKSNLGVSLFGRGMVIAKYNEIMKEKEIVRLGYSQALYNQSIK